MPSESLIIHPTGIKLPFSCEVKLSQFADDTSLIWEDNSSLHESMSVLGKFGHISGLKLKSKRQGSGDRLIEKQYN